MERAFRICVTNTSNNLDAHIRTLHRWDALARGERIRAAPSLFYITGVSRVFFLSSSLVSRLYMAYVIIRHYAVGQRREIASVRGGIHHVKSWLIVPRIRAMVPVMRLF